MGCDFEFTDGTNTYALEPYQLTRNIYRYGAGHLHNVFREAKRKMGTTATIRACCCCHLFTEYCDGLITDEYHGTSYVDDALCDMKDCPFCQT